MNTKKKTKNRLFTTTRVLCCFIGLTLIGIQFEPSIQSVTILPSLLAGVGMGFLTTGILGLFEKFLAIDQLSEIKDAVDELNKDAFQKIEQMNDTVKKMEKAAKLFNLMQQRGVKDICHSNEYIEELRRDIKKAHKIQGIFRTGREFVSSLRREIFAAIKENNCDVEFIISSENVAKGDCLSRICPTTDPCGHIGEFYRTVFYESRNHNYYQKTDNKKGSITIKEYDFAITGSILIIDDDIVRFIPYLPETESTTSIAIIGSIKEVATLGMFEIYKDTFEKIWHTQSKEIDVAEYDEKYSIQPIKTKEGSHANFD